MTSGHPSASQLAELEHSLREVAKSQPGCTPYESRRPIRIPGRLQGKTIAECLASLCPHVPEERWVTALNEDRLQVDGREVNLQEPAFGGMSILYTTLDRTEPPVATNIDLLHMDEHLVILQKPAPLAVHPCGRFNLNTLLNFTKKAWPDEDLRPAHRIDAATTGILVLTRNKRAAHFVQKQFEQRQVQKTYLVRVEGSPDDNQFSVKAKIELAAGDHGRRRLSEDGAPAHTDFEVVQRYEDGTTLLYAHPISGRTNQIRLHLQSCGLPIVGDNAYGRSEDVEGGMVSHEQVLHLHAHAISFRHPDGNRSVKYCSNAPAWGVPDC